MLPLLLLQLALFSAVSLGLPFPPKTELAVLLAGLWTSVEINDMKSSKTSNWWASTKHLYNYNNSELTNLLSFNSSSVFPSKTQVSLENKSNKAYFSLIQANDFQVKLISEFAICFVFNHWSWIMWDWVMTKICKRNWQSYIWTCYIKCVLLCNSIMMEITAHLMIESRHCICLIT